MKSTYRIFILFGLMIGAFLNIVTKFNSLSISNFYFLVISESWILYNFYACFFNRALLAPPNIDAISGKERAYVRFFFVIFINAGLYIFLFFI